MCPSAVICYITINFFNLHITTTDNNEYLMPMFCFSRFLEVFVHQHKLQKGLLDVLINFPILIVSNMFYSTCAMISLNCD